MEEYTCEQSLDFVDPDKDSFTSSSSSSPGLKINFNFSCKLHVSEWIVREDSEELQFLRQIPNLSTMRKQVCLNQDQFLKAREIIDEEIKHWRWRADFRRRVIKFALDKAEEAVKSIPDSHNVVDLNISMKWVHEHVFDERQDIISATQLSMEEDRNYLIPAADSSIEALENKKIVLISEDSETNCSICLEEFNEGCEGISMPCSHLFHGDCIKKWLRTSHYCPLCRFEMPTNR